MAGKDFFRARFAKNAKTQRFSTHAAQEFFAFFYERFVFYSAVRIVATARMRTFRCAPCCGMPARIKYGNGAKRWHAVRQSGSAEHLFRVARKGSKKARIPEHSHNDRIVIMPSSHGGAEASRCQAGATAQTVIRPARRVS